MAHSLYPSISVTASFPEVLHEVNDMQGTFAHLCG